jgi:hypothetical protein
MKVTVSENTTTGVVTATTPGPQGAKGIELNETAKVDKSVVYFDAAGSTFRADSTWTTTTLTDGGNF